MKVFISADMEGTAGIVHREHILPGTVNYERARLLMTREVSAAVEGALEAGAAQVVVNDSHGSMRNLLAEELHPAARLITGFPKPGLMTQGLDGSFDAALFIGYHAMAGAEGLWSHTISNGTFAFVRLNGTEYGETGLNAAVAGHYGVPVALVTGDNFLVHEAKSILPQVVCAQVKESCGYMAADSLSPEHAAKLIREQAALAVTGAGRIKPFVIDGPVNAEIGLKSLPITEVAAVIPGVARTGPMTVSYRAADMPEMMRMITTMMYAACVLSMDLYK